MRPLRSDVLCKGNIMRKILLLAATVATLGITGCETHDRRADWNRRDRGHEEYGRGGYPEHVIERQPPVTVYREYPEYRH